MGNLTPRGLATPIYSSENFKTNPESLGKEENELEFSLYVWSGVSVDPLLKTITIAKALKLEKSLSSNKGFTLKVF